MTEQGEMRPDGRANLWRPIVVLITWITLTQTQAPAQECAFVSVPEEDAITIANLSGGFAVAEVPVDTPRETVLSTAGDRLYAPVNGALAFIDTVSREVEVFRIGRPLSVTLSGDDRRLFAAFHDVLLEIDTRTAEVTARYEIDNNFLRGRIAASFNGSIVYSAGRTRGLWAFDTENVVVTPLEETGTYSSILLDEERGRIWVSGGEVRGIDLSTGEVMSTSELAGELRRGYGADALFAVDRENITGLTGTTVSVPYRIRGDFVATPGGIGIGTSFYGLGTVDLETGFPGALIPLGGEPVLRRLSAGIAPDACSGTGCIGDCDADGDVTVDELVLSLNVALGEVTADACRAADFFADQHVDVTEIVRAVDASLHGCSPERQGLRFSQPIGVDFSGNADFQIADVNVDGFPDLTSARGTSLNLGGGNFERVAQPGFGTVVPDLNGDGFPDKAAGDGDEGRVSIFFGQGDGTFRQAEQSWLLESFYPLTSVCVVAGDVNSDGAIDLVALRVFGEALTLLGTGDGHFTEVQALPPIQTFFGGPAVVVDLNDDGIPDLLTPQSTGHRLGVGDGTFLSPFALRAEPLATGTGGAILNDESSSILELNNDGFPDQIRPSTRIATIPLSQVLIGSPGPRFTEASLLPRLGRLVAGDLDGDDIPDLVNDDDGVLWIFRGQGDGHFHPPFAIDVGAQVQQADMADMNLDGRLDLVISARTGAFLLLNEAD